MRLVTVLVDAPEGSDGDHGDGVIRLHFRRPAEARTFAAGRTLYGSPLGPGAFEVEDVPTRIAARWVRQGKVIG